MAMSNQECIEYLEGFDRLKNMDPKMRKIIIDRAIKGIKSLDQHEKNQQYNQKKKEEIIKKFDIVRVLANRYHALTVKEVNAYMVPGKLGEPMPEEIFLKNILLIFCEARTINKENSTDFILNYLMDLYTSALKPLCRFTHGGTMCPFCDIKDCELSACKTPEEREKMKDEIMKQIEEEAEK